MDPQLIFGGIKLLGGLFANKANKKAAAAAEAARQAEIADQRAFEADAGRRNIMSQFEGVREAAAKYGFNPLTVAQYGQTGGGGITSAVGAGGSAPPLASNELLMGGLADIGDVLSGEKAQRVAANKLQTELGQIKLDQLRASAATKVGAGASPLGRRSVQTFSTSVPTKVELQYGLGPLKVEPKAVSTPFVTSNGEVVSVPNGGDLDEVVTGAAIEGLGYAKNRLRPFLPNIDNVDGGSVVDGAFSLMRRSFMPAVQFPKTAFTKPSKLDKRALDLWTQIAP